MVILLSVDFITLCVYLILVFYLFVFLVFLYFKFFLVEQKKIKLLRSFLEPKQQAQQLWLFDGSQICVVLLLKKGHKRRSLVFYVYLTNTIVFAAVSVFPPFKGPFWFYFVWSLFEFLHLVLFLLVCLVLNQIRFLYKLGYKSYNFVIGADSLPLKIQNLIFYYYLYFIDCLFLVTFLFLNTGL